MDCNRDLRGVTSKHFDDVNFSELSESWIRELILNEFTDAGENNISLSMLFVNNPTQTLNKLADICLDWCNKSNDDDSAISDSPELSRREEVLWTILDEMDINIKHIQSIVYLLCKRAVKKDASIEDKAVGLACAKLYYNCLRLPGSGAYSVYHPNLFNLCIDCFPAPDLALDKDIPLRDFDKLTITYVSSLFSLISVLKDFHLGDDSSILENAVKKLVELSALEVHSVINFHRTLEIEEKELRRRFKLPSIVSILAYRAFLAILSTDLNGDIDKNYLLIFSLLNKYISCYNARKGQTVPHKHLVIKDNAVAFICYILKTQGYFPEATQLAIKRLCLGVIDKTEIRNTVASAVTTILLNMNAESVEEMVQWFLLLIDSAETRDRAFTLDIFSQLLSSIYKANSDVLPEPLKNVMLKAAIIFAIFTRCDDTSPLVRTKALTVLSLNMKYILNFLDETKDQATFDIEDHEDEVERDLDVNGNHRFFWYNLASFRERLNEIAAILQRRVEDSNVTARKAALLALENLIVFDQTYVTEENLKFFECATKDTNIVVRKQVMQTLSVILDTYPENTDIQSVWIKCILPLVHDPETSVQDKALSILDDQFLQKVFSSKQADKEAAFTLLKMLSSADFLAHQRYLQKSFSLWKSANRLRSQSLIQLEKYVGTEFEECIWFYISNFAMYSSIPGRVSNLCVEQFEKFDTTGQYPRFMEYIMKVLSHTCKSLDLEKSEIVRCVISGGLKSFSVPVEFIPIYIEILYKILKHRNTESEFDEFSSLIIQKCEEHLLEIKTATSLPEPPSEELLAKYFCSIKEFCQMCPSNITKDIISLLKTFSACVKPSKTLSKILSPSLKAHAFAALGKICIQDEVLAKDLLSVYAKELLTSKYDVIRNNIVIILIEMCKRYTSFADKYVPLISLCFKDKLYLIRYQTIVLVVNLLQEGYIKWRGLLFFCLLSTLVDKKEAIQELGRYSLSQLLHDKKKNLFSEHFLESVFVYNFFMPPDNEQLSQTVKDLERFSIPGEHKRGERMLLYRFLLESMDIKERAYLINSIREILMSVAESVYPLNETVECMVRDCFAILTCNEIRCFNVEQYDALEDATDELSTAELQTRKIIIIDPIIPVIVSLKNGITDPESDLMRDLIFFLKDLLHDFKDSLKDILAIDKILLRQLELEIRNDAEKERVEKRKEKELRERTKHVSREPSEDSHVTLHGIQARIQEVASKIVDNDKVVGNQDKDCDKSHSRHFKRQKSPSKFGPHTPPKAIPSTSRSSTSSEISSQGTYNISTANEAEMAEIQRLASTPRVLLTQVNVPLKTNILNISAIENFNQPMNVDESDEVVFE